MLNFRIRKFTQKSITNIIKQLNPKSSEINIIQLNNINKLIQYVFLNNTKLTNQNLQKIIAKFTELRVKEPNSKFKAYELFDYIITPSRNYDLSLINSMIRILITNNINDSIYWKFIKQTILDNGILLEEGNFIPLMKGFALSSYIDEELWNLFEEITIDKYESLNQEDIESVTICFINKKKGSEKFLNKLLDYTLSNIENCSSEIILTYTHGILLNYRNLDIYDKFLVVSTNYILENLLKESTTEEKQSVENIDIIYSLFTNFHRLTYINKIYKNSYILYKENMRKFCHKLDQILHKYLTLQISKFEEEDFEQIANILVYIRDSDHSGSAVLRHLKPKIFLEIFLKNYQQINSSKSILNFLSYFAKMRIKAKYFTESKVIENEVMWEKLVDNMHKYSYQELVLVFKVIDHYEVKYNRIWIFVQTFLRKCILSEDIESEERLKRVNKILTLISKAKTKNEDLVIVHFLYYLKYQKMKLSIENSYI